MSTLLKIAIPQILFRRPARHTEQQILAAYAKAVSDARFTTPVSLEVV